MASQDFVLSDRSRFFRNAHVQTLGAVTPFVPSRSARPPVPVVEQSLRIALPPSDGGTAGYLHAKASWPQQKSGATIAQKPLVVLVHGIGGSSESSYVIRAAAAMLRAGYATLRLNLRGAGTSIGDAPSLYHAGLSDDLAHVAHHFANDPRAAAGVVLVGFSGGGSMALKLAGELGELGELGEPHKKHALNIRAVVSLSAPLDYPRVAAFMDTWARFPYRFHVLRGLTRGARAFAKAHPERARHYRARDVARLGTFRNYDATVIVPMHGFENVDAYYAAASPGPYLAHIRIPTLLVHAEDDPMVPFANVKPWLSSVSPAVSLALSRHGGHLGWVDRFDEKSRTENWPIARALAFLEATLAT